MPAALHLADLTIGRLLAIERVAALTGRADAVATLCVGSQAFGRALARRLAHAIHARHTRVAATLTTHPTLRAAIARDTGFGGTAASASLATGLAQQAARPLVAILGFVAAGRTAHLGLRWASTAAATGSVLRRARAATVGILAADATDIPATEGRLGLSQPERAECARGESGQRHAQYPAPRMLAHDVLYELVESSWFHLLSLTRKCESALPNGSTADRACLVMSDRGATRTKVPVAFAH